MNPLRLPQHRCGSSRAYRPFHHPDRDPSDRACQKPRSLGEGANNPVVRLCPSRHIWLQRLRFGAQCTRPATFKGSSGGHRLKNSLNFDL